MSSILKYSYRAQLAFTLAELMIVTIIIGILAAVSIPAYQKYLISAQVSESLNMTYGLKTSVATNLQYGTCFANRSPTASTVKGIDSISGKYGTATITSTNAGLPPCGIEYKFISNGVSNALQNKTIAFSVSSNGVLGKSSSTTIDEKYLPHALK